MNAHARHGWLLLAFCLLIQALTVGICTYAFAFFVVPWMQEFSAPRSELMLAMSGFSIVIAVMSLFGGGLVDRYSARLLVCMGAVIFAGGLFAMALAPSAYVVVAVFALVLPASVIFAGPIMAQTLVARHFIERRGMALGICALGTSVGGLLTPPIVTALLEIYTWRVVLALFGAIELILVIPAALVLLRPQPDATAHKPGGTKLGQLLMNPSVWLIALAYVAPMAMFLSVLYNIGAYAADLAITQQHAGAVISITSLLMAGGKFAVGALADRVDHRALYFSLLVLVGIGMALIGSSGNVYTMSIGVPILGASIGGMMPLFSSIIVRRFGPASFGSVLGVVLALASLSGLAPSVVGLVRDMTGSYSAAFLSLLVLLIPATLAFLAVTRVAPIPRQSVAG